MTRAIKVVMVLGMVAILAYAGLCIYGNVTGMNTVAGNPPKMPEVQDAQYAVVIENTGRALLTNDYEQLGDLYILHGFWELEGNKFQYRDRDLHLDEGIFGEVNVTRR